MRIYKEKLFWDIYKIKKNLMNVVYFKKIVLNIGCGFFFNNKNLMNKVYINLSNISNQIPVFVKCKKSVSSFKIKKNDIISIMVTLRGKIMYNFLDKFINLFLPKIKNFKKFNIKSFDLEKNFNFGIVDYSDFFEVENHSEIIGMNINISFLNNNYNYSLVLLKFMKFNF